MSALAQLTLWQTRLQWRYGILAAAMFVTLVWAAVLWLLPQESLARLLPAILLGDTAIFGFYLLTGMLFLENDDHVLDALRVMPLSPGRDLLARAVPLTLASVLIGAGITLVAHGMDFNWIALFLGLGFAAPMHMLAGVAYAARFRSITDYIFPAAPLLILAGIPFFHYYGIWQPAVMWALPTMPPLTLLRGMFEPLSALGWAYGVLGSMLWTSLAFVWAKGEIHRFGRRRAKGSRGDLGGAEEDLSAGSSSDRTRSTSTDPLAIPTPAASEIRARSDAPTSATSATTTASSIRNHGVAALAVADLRNIRREPLLAFMSIYAITLAFVVRWMMPVLEGLLEETLDLTPYYPLIASSFAVAATPIMLGSVIGLLLLDERDEGSLAALRVTPLPTAHYALYRAAFPTLISVFFSFFVVRIVDLVVPSNVDLLPVAVLSAVEAPIAMLFLAGFAGNKVEGLALMKGLGFLLFGPIVAWFVAPPWRWLFGFMPSYWPAEAFWRISGATGVGGVAGASQWPVLIIGFMYHALLVWWLARRFIRRV